MSYIQITLMSDTCIASGEIYNCLVDADVCYDKYGLPYIPAKRLKGCLRETAHELVDWGKNINIKKIFGEAGSCIASMRLSNANLFRVEKDNFSESSVYNYEDYVEDILQERNRKYSMPQNVLEQFTYMRTQTAIDEKTGTARRNSLRNIRVLKKGLSFQAKVSFLGTEEEIIEMEQQVKQCCLALKFMGLNRTRGMGEVKVEFVIESEQATEIKENLECLVNLPDGRQCLNYTILLKAPLLTRSISSGQEVTENYIEGSKMLGFLAHHVSHCDQDFNSFMRMGELICSNAYISKENKRYMPISAGFYSMKGHTSDSKKKELRDRTVSDRVIGEYKKTNEDMVEQLNSLGDIYALFNEENEMHTMSVDTEIRYHHARPQDKSIGRANAKQSVPGNLSDEDKGINGEFYQLESLCEGQSFSGIIIGSKEQMKKIVAVLQRHKKTRMGYNRSSEYGEVEIQISTSPEVNMLESVKCDEFVLKLESPMILYNKQGMYSTDPEVMLNEVENLLGGIELTISKQFTKYKMLRGYNTKWRKRKPVIYIFDKGTTFVLKSKQEVDLAELSNHWLGERVNEGFGQISVYPVSTEYALDRIKDDEKLQTPYKNLQEDKTDLVKKIANKLAREEIKASARRCAINKVCLNKREEIKPIIYQLWFKLNKEYGLAGMLSREEFQKLSGEGADSSKNKNTVKNSRQVRKKLELTKIILHCKEIDSIVDDKLRFCYVQALLEEMKYQVEMKKGEKSK